jgi:PHD/YefM family antitoxin component YafN of YafNO toxin-antitoxin module
MIKTQNTQSLTDFRANAMRTLERLNASGDAEIITVNGEAKAVLLSPAVYDAFARQIELASTVDRIQKSLKEVDASQSREGFEVLNALREHLLSSKPDAHG